MQPKSPVYALNSAHSIKLSVSALIYGLLACFWHNGWAQTTSPLAELVWVEQQEKQNTIYISALINEKWTAPQQIYQSTELLTSPALGTDNSGNQLLIWTEYRRSKTVLKSSRRNNGESWQEPTLFSDTGSENYASCIVFDRQNNAWVFWSSTRSDLSDIFFSKSEGFTWSRPQLVHSANAVPDILPIAALTPEGHVRVSWTRYSFKQNSYTQDEKTFAKNVTQPNPAPLLDAVSEKDIKLPAFLSRNSVSLLHFPGNEMIQSRPISPSN